MFWFGCRPILISFLFYCEQWRAPQEYLDKPLNEKIDVWSLGNNFFSLLTGYYPFPNIEKGEIIRVSETGQPIGDRNCSTTCLLTCSISFQQQKIAKGATAKIDPRFYNRSFAEAKLIEVIKRCYVYDPDERADIGELKKMLEVAIAENEEVLKRGEELGPNLNDKTTANTSPEASEAAAPEDADHHEESDSEDEDLEHSEYEEESGSEDEGSSSGDSSDSGSGDYNSESFSDNEE